MNKQTLRRCCARALAAAAAVAVTLAATPASAVQTASYTLPMAGLESRVAFSFRGLGPGGPGGPGVSPQTGLTSSVLLGVNVGAALLLAPNPLASINLTYDSTGLQPIAGGDSVFQAYSGGTTLDVSLPGGSGGGAPLIFSNVSGGLSFAAFVDNGRQLATGDLLPIPGGVDFFSVGLVFGYLGEGLVLGNTPTALVKINLLADPLFPATYNSPVPLPPALVVTLQMPTSVRLSAPSLNFLDTDGTAFSGLQPPATVPLDAFERVALSMAFSGDMVLTLDPADYASTADYLAADSWLTANGPVRAQLSQSAVWSTPVPEPATWLLWLAGLVALPAWAQHRARSLQA
jgi:hypothetical protein